MVQISYSTAKSHRNKTKLVAIVIYLIYHLEQPCKKNALWKAGPPEPCELDTRLCFTQAESPGLQSLTHRPSHLFCELASVFFSLQHD